MPAAVNVKLHSYFGWRQMWPESRRPEDVTSGDGRGETGPGEEQGTLQVPRAWGPRQVHPVILMDSF